MYVYIKLPNVVWDYNRHKCEFNIFVRIMGIYKMITWTFLLHERVTKYKNFLESGSLALKDFRLKVIKTLFKIGIKFSLFDQRSLEGEIQAKSYKGPAQPVPPIADC